MAAPCYLLTHIKSDSFSEFQERVMQVIQTKHCSTVTISHGAIISMEMTGINKEFNELFYEHSFFQQTTAEYIAKLDDTCTHLCMHYFMRKWTR